MKTNDKHLSLGMSAELIGLSLLGIGAALLVGLATDAVGLTDFAVGAPLLGLIG